MKRDWKGWLLLLLPCVLGLGLVAMTGVLILGSRVEEPCVENVRILTVAGSIDHRDWTHCPHSQHKMIERVYTNQMLITCVCVKPGEPWDGRIEVDVNKEHPDAGPQIPPPSTSAPHDDDELLRQLVDGGAP